MPLRIYKLSPGESVTYDLRPVGPSASATESGCSEPLHVRVERPREGASVELELNLMSASGVGLASGRVPLERGYMAVVQELRRELGRSKLWPPGLEFELLARESDSGSALKALGADAS